MKSLLTRLMCALAVLCLIAPQPAFAQMDPVARGLAAKGLTVNAPKNSMPGVYNLDATSLPKFRAAMAKYLAGTSDAVIDAYGDSLTGGGIGHLGGGVWTNARVTSYPYRFAAELTRLGYNVSTDSFFSDNRSGNLNSYNPNVTVGAGWAPATGVFPRLLGGYPFANTTTTNAMVLTTIATEDTCDLYYVTDPTFGSISWAVDGGSATNISEAATRAMAKTTVSLGTSATHTISIARVSGTAWFQGMDCYNSTVRRIRVRNLGISGATSSEFVSTAQNYSMGNVIGPTLKADLGLIMLGVNDMNTSVADATIKTNLTSLIGLVEQNGDVAMIVPFPSKTATISAAVQARLSADILAVAGTRPVVSWPYRVVDWSTAATNGFGTVDDDLHPLAVGYQDFATWLRTILVDRISAVTDERWSNLAANDNRQFAAAA